MNKTDIIENLDMVVPADPYAWVVPTSMIVGVVLAIGAVAYILYRKKKLPFQAASAIPPDITALEALAKIRHLLKEELCREFVIEVSKILRYYIEARFGLRAPHLSSEEFLYHAESSEALNPAQRTMLADFLVQCDRVKFAMGGLEIPAMTALYQAAETFVRQTKPQLPSPTSGVKP